jgi:hypothetical protein
MLLDITSDLQYKVKIERVGFVESRLFGSMLETDIHHFYVEFHQKSGLPKDTLMWRMRSAISELLLIKHFGNPASIDIEYIWDAIVPVYNAILSSFSKKDIAFIADINKVAAPLFGEISPKFVPESEIMCCCGSGKKHKNCHGLS